jgi:hypothetical protein
MALRQPSRSLAQQDENEWPEVKETTQFMKKKQHEDGQLSVAVQRDEGDFGLNCLLPFEDGDVFKRRFRAEGST